MFDMQAETDCKLPQRAGLYVSASKVNWGTPEGAPNILHFYSAETYFLPKKKKTTIMVFAFLFMP